MSDLAYAWNAPRPAISGYEYTDTPRGIMYLTPEGNRKFLTIAELAETDEKKDRCRAVRRRLASLPHFVRRNFSQKLERIDRKGKKTADAWLLNTFERFVLSRIDQVNEQYLPQAVLPAALLPLHSDFWRLLWAGKKEMKRLAYNLADILGSEFNREFEFQLARTADPHFATLSGYGRMGFLVSHLNMPIPCWTAYCKEELEGEEALNAVARLQSPQWWLNRLRRINSRWREHLMIAAGYVHKKASAYCSDPCLQEWTAQKKANREFLKAMELEDEDTGERVSLIDKVAASVANPANRRRELMARMRGFEDIANDLGLAGAFFTLTAPSKYHSMQYDGRRNNKYSGASPRETQKYLCNVWARTRAAWLRKGIRVFGFRVAEPHHDETPHWHLLLFMLPENIQQATGIFRSYAMQEDGHEPGAAENRFEMKPIDKEKGSATGYIAKYISKNIDGYQLDDELDDETGKPLKEMARRVSAWSSRWAIRQFQQIGGAPVTVWRELRRLGDRELVLHPEIEPVRQAADGSAWDLYVNAQGGPLVSRDKLRVRLCYEVTENGNIYGDDVSKISGLYSPVVGADSQVHTRTTKYKIVPKRQSDDASGFDVDFSGGAAAPRSSVNNCTREPRTVEKTAELDIESLDLSSLSRKEKKLIARRLSDEASASERSRKERAFSTERRYQHGQPAEKVRDFAQSIGWDIGETEIGLLLSGQKIALDGVFYESTSDGTLYRVRGKSPKSNMTTINTWLERLGTSYRYKGIDK
ncbi:replication endonuclease [Citrobacter portucalensis]|uniref:replication endonuclease n=1 Tax=Citrobacter portucalensis TaxID=1639133 RepID=UPI00226B8BE1|nr:replication endonuclease [Citrobacter portucalensis]MCX9067680.1 replication endonuclease [Citrobacter portucalensis]